MGESGAIAKFWIATSKQIEHVLSHERFTQTVEPTKDARIVHRLVSDTYCRYVGLCRSLDRCFDQTLQVQKRQVIQQLLETATARLLELRSKLQDIELSEFVYVDGALQELHFMPDDVEAVKPYYLPAKRPADLQRLLDSRKLEKFAPDDDSTEDDSEVHDSDQQEEEETSDTLKRPAVKRDRRRERLRAALALITAHEKARQARVRQTNFRLHPDRYYPKPIDDEIEDIQYDFSFRPGQTMLYPVKRTVFNWDFRMKKKNVANFAYYAPPGYREERLPSVDSKPTKGKRKHRVASRAHSRPSHDEAAVHQQAEEARTLKLRNSAATRIQRCWRRYYARKAMKRARYEKLKFLGLFDDFESNETQASGPVDRVRASRRERREEYDRAFLEAVADEKARILRTRGPGLLEDIGDIVRAWFRQWYEEAHAFDVIPELFEGGTILVVRGETLTTLEYLEQERRKQLEKLKSAEQKKKEAEAKKAAKEAEQAKKREERERAKELAREKRAREKKEGKTYDFAGPEFVSNAYVTLNETIRRYRQNWAFVEELENPKDLPIMEWITLEKFAEVHQELHAEVHELLKGERELLQMALCKDERSKYKPAKPKKPPRAKGARKGKRKGAHDAIPNDRPLETMLDELAGRNVIKSYRARIFEDFVGDFNYSAFERRNRLEQDPPAGMGELRTILRSYLFGMGPLSVAKPKSVCLVGPRGCGKTMLLETICHETGSVLFDLGAETCGPIAASDVPSFLQLVLTVARLLQPSVLAIEGVHRAFYKKVPPQEQSIDPGKLGKHLFKQLVKQLKPDDKVLLVATSDQPWLAKVGPLKKCFEKFVLVPRPDYGTMVLLWQHALRRFVSVPRDLDLSALATVTRGYSAGQILHCTDAVLGIRRRMQFGRRPLQVQELHDHLLHHSTALADSEYEKYVKWHSKVDKLAKMRAKVVRERQLLANQAGAKSRK